MLFSAPLQAIFEVNETAAYIWKAIESGAPMREIVQVLVDGGASVEQARTTLDTALGDWQSQELIHPNLTSIQLDESQRRHQHLAVSDTRVRLTYPKWCADSVPAFFNHLETDETDGQVQWEVAENAGRFHLFREGEWIDACGQDELPTVLKGHLLSETLDGEDYEFAVHAATLFADDRALLLFGRPGAGKTTLALGLVHAGFGFGGDDVALFRPGGLCRPLPFASAVKTGSMRLLKEQVPGLAQIPAFRRPDRKRVRYVVPDTPVATADREVGWIFLLDRRPECAPRLHPVYAGEALQGVLADSSAKTGELTETAFNALVHAVASAQVYRLTYSGLGDAVELIGRTCK